MAKQFSGVTGRMLEQQKAERDALKKRHEREKERSKSWKSRTKTAAYQRSRIKERQAMETAALLNRQKIERESAKARVNLERASVKSEADLRKQYEAGNIRIFDFRAENLRYALLNYHNLSGQERADFEHVVRAMSIQDITNLGRMYGNVLETWKDSHEYFEAISEEVMKRIKGMANQTTRNISRMLAKGESKLDDETVKMALEGWNFRLGGDNGRRTTLDEARSRV